MLDKLGAEAIIELSEESPRQSAGSSFPVGSIAASKCERLASNAPHESHLVTHQPLHIASFGAVWSIYPQCYLMSGYCLAGLGWLPVVPSLAFVVVSLVLADHWGGGSLNDGLVAGHYRFRLMEQF